jgi:hypothetical protein
MRLAKSLGSVYASWLQCGADEFDRASIREDGEAAVHLHLSVTAVHEIKFNEHVARDLLRHHTAMLRCVT